MNPSTYIDAAYLNKILDQLGSFQTRTKVELSLNVARGTRGDFDLNQEKIRQLEDTSPITYGILGLEQISEVLGIELVTFKRLMFDPSFFGLYFSSVTGLIPDTDKVLILDHYLSAIKRHFIGDLASAVEYGIRRLVDRFHEKPKSNKEKCKEFCERKEVSLSLPQNSLKPIWRDFLSDFVEFEKYCNALSVVGEKYGDFIRIVKASRNSMHNGGFYRGPHLKVTYHDIEYIFQDGEQVSFDLSQSCIFLNEALDLFKDVVDELDR